LLISGANPDSLTRAGKASPLHRAAYSGHSDIVKILAEHGAQLDLVDIDGQTALHKAMLIYYIYSRLTMQSSQFSGAKGLLPPILPPKIKLSAAIFCCRRIFVSLMMLHCLLNLISSSEYELTYDYKISRGK
jgi:hypothetical protein